MRNFLLMCLLVLAGTSAYAQDTLCGHTETLLGAANNLEHKPLIGVKLQWLGTNVMAVSNPLGDFCIPIITGKNMLVISKNGFRTDTLAIEDLSKHVVLTLQKNKAQLAEIKVSNSAKTTSISYLSASQLLKIKEGEFLKAACCNLSESFETTPSVDVSFTDAITGQKQIQMLGLATPNTLITQENIPNIRGLASTIGLNYTPGTWVQGMQLSKGTGSVVNGYEGLAGQINVELKKPDDEKEQYYLNVYQNTGGRFEANANIFKKVNKNFAAGFLLHHKNQFATTDNNRDNFMDNPKGQQNVGAFRAQYFSDNGFELQTILRVISTAELSGELTQTAAPSLGKWRYDSDVQRREATVKIGKLYTKKPWKSMGLQLAGFQHQQNMSASSRLPYYGSHKNLYANYIFQTMIGNTNHGIKMGASMLYDSITESLPLSTINYLRRSELAIGGFVEHTYNYLDKLTLVSGLRLDNHNLFGAFLTPRVHVRYTPKYGTVLRASIGKARRTVSMVSENLPLYFTQRNVVLQGDSSIWLQGLQPEIAWNFGTSITQDFMLNYRKGTAVLDYYYTYFIKQWIADYETPRELYFYANDKNSYAHAVQATVDYEIIRKRLDIRIAYKYYDVVNNYRGTAMQKGMQARHRGFVNLSYKTRSKWSLDGTVNYTGIKRLPNAFSESNDVDFYHRKFSEAFFTVNAHASKELAKNFEVYVGGENLTNYMMHHAIIANNNPFSNNFDATQVWGPVMGINGYIGLRLKGAWKK